MQTHPITIALSSLCFFFFHIPLITSATSLPIRAVNLGGWLVTEGWITPSLFKEIPNNDFLDGNQIWLKSVTTGKYLSAENGGGSTIFANRPKASGWETFKIWRVDSDNFKFRVMDKYFVGLESDGAGVTVVATATDPRRPSLIFQIVRKRDDPYRVKIKASNGLYLRANSETSVTANAADGYGDWGDEDNSAFLLDIRVRMSGEYQVTNGYGRDKARMVLKEHWSTFITEEDFRDIANKGLNAVRIPVGWWIAYDTNPPPPFVDGSLPALDNAFAWAEKYGLGIIVDLHAAPGAQNADDHGGSRDGRQTWGYHDIPQTVEVIDFLTERYARRSALLGMELMNEPRAPGVSLSSLKSYYQTAYDAVRKHTSTAYVIMSNRLGDAHPRELLDFAAGFHLAVLDVHYYNLYTPEFDMKSVQYHINYVYRQRDDQLKRVTAANGRPLVFVGEWTGGFKVTGATMSDYGRFAAAQLEVFGRATFGWAYWTWKTENNDNNYWSLRWMIEKGYITLAK